MMIKMPDIIYAILNNLLAVIFFGVFIVAGVIYYWQRKRERKTDAKP
jgi:TRAP-type C4-dicarboxylate transport system permease small subunit